MSTVVKDLVRKRWVSRRRSVKDDRVVVLSLSRLGDTLALQIEQRVQQFSATLAEQNRKTLSMV
jgi:DNA-binding MarR family transcriptional regulator